jgi:hypothetical protein
MGPTGQNLNTNGYRAHLPRATGSSLTGVAGEQLGGGARCREDGRRRRAAVRRRSSSSSTLSRRRLEGGSGTPGTRGRPGARPAPASSNLRETSGEIMSRGFLVMAWFFSGKRCGPFIGGRGSTRRGDLGRERGRCRLQKGRGGRGFRRRAAACCGVLLAHLRAAGWSGAEGASNGCGEGSGVVLLCSSVSHGPGSGLGSWGSTKECPRHGYRAWDEREQRRHSRTDFPWISLTTCSVKCPQEIKI